LGSAIPLLKGQDFAIALFRQIDGMVRESIRNTGDIDPEPIATALEHALRIPECRDAVIHMSARFIACSLSGCVPDLTK
jgi:hypothetical protein